MTNTAHELPYAAFARHLGRSDTAPPEVMAPVHPVSRIGTGIIATLHGLEEQLAQAQIDTMAQFPEEVRLQLCKLLLAGSERIVLARRAFDTFQSVGRLTIKPPARSRRTSWCKPFCDHPIEARTILEPHDSTAGPIRRKRLQS